MVPLETPFDATNVQATITLAIGHWPLATAKIMIKTNWQPASSRRHTLGKLSRHANCTFAFAFALAFALPLAMPAIIVRPGTVHGRWRQTRGCNKCVTLLQDIASCQILSTGLPSATSWMPCRVLSAASHKQLAVRMH